MICVTISLDFRDPLLSIYRIDGRDLATWGWMMGLMHDFSQDLRISSLRGDVRWQGEKVESIDSDLTDLEKLVVRMQLAVEAMAEIMESRIGIEHREIIDKMFEIDLRDGKRDGRITPVPVTCKKCQRPSPANAPKCIYCGQSREDVGGVTSIR
jgi:hypothetical protein